MRSKLPLRSLYAICDTSFSPQHSHVELARLLLLGGAPILQLRMKGEKDVARIRRTTQGILALKKEFSFTLLLNDFVQVASDLPVDGIHLGQDDLPLPEARERVGRDKIIGYSSHSLEEAKRAQAQGADYVAFGAIFPTKTKGPGHPVQGVEKLKAVVQSLSVPVVAIGGIGRDNLEAVLKTGVASVAMITALTQAQDLIETTRWFVNKIRAQEK